MARLGLSCFFFFFNDTATTEIYTLSLHDALPIWTRRRVVDRDHAPGGRCPRGDAGRADDPARPGAGPRRSEEHTSELQSRQYLVCRLLLEKKQNRKCDHALQCHLLLAAPSPVHGR